MPKQHGSGTRGVETFREIAEHVVWATVSTVDPAGRPWSRILHPLWSGEGEDLSAVVLTRPTRLKVEHIAAHPFVSVSYWHPDHSVATAECHAAWGDTAERACAWDLALTLPAPYGYDPSTIWPQGRDKADPHDCAVLMLRPWRLRAATAQQLAQNRAQVWKSSATPRSPRARAAKANDGEDNHAPDHRHNNDPQNRAAWSSNPRCPPPWHFAAWRGGPRCQRRERKRDRHLAKRLANCGKTQSRRRGGGVDIVERRTALGHRSARPADDNDRSRSKAPARSAALRSR